MGCASAARAAITDRGLGCESPGSRYPRCVFGDRSKLWRSRIGCLGVAMVLLLSLSGAGASAALAASAPPQPNSGAAVGGANTTPEGANGNAFNELSQGGGEPETQTQSTGNRIATTPPKNSKKTVLVIVIAALAVLVAIAFVIVRDARRVAPAGDPQLAEARSAHDSAATLRKRRARAKAARQARKRNR
jgi:hypothetical protein